MGEGIGCACGWPLDSCNPKFAEGKSCDRLRHERRLQAEYMASPMGRAEDLISRGEFEAAVPELFKVIQDLTAKIYSRPELWLQSLEGPKPS